MALFDTTEQQQLARTRTEAIVLNRARRHIARQLIDAGLVPAIPRPTLPANATPQQIAEHQTAMQAAEAREQSLLNAVGGAINGNERAMYTDQDGNELNIAALIPASERARARGIPAAARAAGNDAAAAVRENTGFGSRGFWMGLLQWIFSGFGLFGGPSFMQCQAEACAPNIGADFARRAAANPALQPYLGDMPGGAAGLQEDMTNEVRRSARLPAPAPRSDSLVGYQPAGAQPAPGGDAAAPPGPGLGAAPPAPGVPAAGATPATQIVDALMVTVARQNPDLAVTTPAGRLMRTEMVAVFAELGRTHKDANPPLTAQQMATHALTALTAKVTELSALTDAQLSDRLRASGTQNPSAEQITALRATLTRFNNGLSDTPANAADRETVQAIITGVLGRRNPAGQTLLDRLRQNPAGLAAAPAPDAPRAQPDAAAPAEQQQAPPEQETPAAPTAAELAPVIAGQLLRKFNTPQMRQVLATYARAEGSAVPAAAGMDAAATATRTRIGDAVARVFAGEATALQAPIDQAIASAGRAITFTQVTRQEQRQERVTQNGQTVTITRVVPVQVTRVNYDRQQLATAQQEFATAYRATAEDIYTRLGPMANDDMRRALAAEMATQYMRQRFGNDRLFGQMSSSLAYNNDPAITAFTQAEQRLRVTVVRNQMTATLSPTERGVMARRMNMAEPAAMDIIARGAAAGLAELDGATTHTMEHYEQVMRRHLQAAGVGEEVTRHAIAENLAYRALQERAAAPLAAGTTPIQLPAQAPTRHQTSLVRAEVIAQLDTPNMRILINNIRLNNNGGPIDSTRLRSVTTEVLVGVMTHPDRETWTPEQFAARFRADLERRLCECDNSTPPRNLVGFGSPAQIIEYATAVTGAVRDQRAGNAATRNPVQEVTDRINRLVNDEVDKGLNDEYNDGWPGGYTRDLISKLNRPLVKTIMARELTRILTQDDIAGMTPEQLREHVRSQMHRVLTNRRGTLFTCDASDMPSLEHINMFIDKLSDKAADAIRDYVPELVASNDVNRGDLGALAPQLAQLGQQMRNAGLGMGGAA